MYVASEIPVTSQLAECLYVGVRNRVRVRVRVRNRFRDGVRDRMLGFGELGRNRNSGVLELMYLLSTVYTPLHSTPLFTKPASRLR